MKFSKKHIAFVIIFAMIVNFSMIASIPVLAHGAVLNVQYDDCVANKDGDGIDEMWYILSTSAGTHHIGHEVSTIRYYFEETNPITGCTWIPEGGSEADAEEIKNAFANSMKKWNNVYFYSYNSDDSITKNKLIEIVEGTEDQNNVRIRPRDNMNSIATTQFLAFDTTTMPDNHKHHSQWSMDVNINYFFYGSPIPCITTEEINYYRESTGAHEFGHVLGLGDVDSGNICDSNESGNHHTEILMGYSSEELRIMDITYKDIAGVAITRGFHTDDDHQWLNMGQQSDGTYKYVCSICNGIPKDSDFTPSSYDTYGSCYGVHSLSGGNMMAVASYENKDYYKCKYCRYVESFANISTQNYKKCYYSAELHKCVNIVDGLEYFFYEPHTLVDGECTECTPHRYDHCVYLNKLSHHRVCACGVTNGIGRHYIYGSTQGEIYAPCGGCGAMLDLRDGAYDTIMSITQVSVNGSYIRSDGIVVLVDEDIEAYLAGTLQFYHPEDVPLTQ